MTTPTPNRAEEIAEKLYRKLREPFSGTQAEMRQQDVSDIAKALEKYAREANEKAEVCARAHREQYERWEEAEKEAFEQGAASMRERAIKACDCIECIVAIRKLPLTPDEDKGVKRG